MPEDIDAYLAGRSESAASAEYVDYPLPQQQRTFIYRIKRSSQLVVPAVLRRPARWDAVRRVVEQFKANPNAPVQPSEFQVFAYCAAQATSQHPKFRSQLVGEDTLRQYQHVNLGIAVARPGDELVTALVKNASALDFVSFVRALQPNFPPVPAEKKPRGVNWRMVFIVLGSLLAISLLLMFAVATVP